MEKEKEDKDIFVYIVKRLFFLPQKLLKEKKEINTFRLLINGLYVEV